MDRDSNRSLLKKNTQRSLCRLSHYLSRSKGNVEVSVLKTSYFLQSDINISRFSNFRIKGIALKLFISNNNLLVQHMIYKVFFITVNIKFLLINTRDGLHMWHSSGTTVFSSRRQTKKVYLNFDVNILRRSCNHVFSISLTKHF